MLASSASLGKPIHRAVAHLARNLNHWQRCTNRAVSSTFHDVYASDPVRRIETLALDRIHDLHKVQREALRFSESAEKMSPTTLIRGLNAFANIGFCNQQLLVFIAERAEELCDTSSPKRLNHLITLLKRLNVTHPRVLGPFISALKLNLHNYVEELPDIIFNVSHLAPDDKELLELLRTQAMLHFEELGKLSIRCAEALSRYRDPSCSFINRTKDTYMPSIKELNLKQKLYLLGALARSGLEPECNTLVNELHVKLCATPFTQECISRILAVKRSIGVVASKIVGAVINDIETRITDQDSLRSSFIYHLYTMCLLGETNSETLCALLERISEKGTMSLSGIGASQLLYAISLITSERGTIPVAPTVINQLCNQLEECHRRLRIPQQAELYESLICLQGHIQLPPGLSRFVSSMIPSYLPGTCPKAQDQQLGEVSGIYYMYQESGDKPLYIFVTVGEQDVLTVTEAKCETLIRPSLRHTVDTLESLLNSRHDSRHRGKVSYRITSSLEDKNLAR